MSTTDPTPTALTRRLRSDESLRTLARDLSEGHALMCFDVPQDLWPMVFLPLMGMPKEQMTKVAAVFGYRRDALTMGINGFPCFSAIELLCAEDVTRLQQFIRQYADMQQAYQTGALLPKAPGS